MIWTTESTLNSARITGQTCGLLLSSKKHYGDVTKVFLNRFDYDDDILRSTDILFFVINIIVCVIM